MAPASSVTLFANAWASGSSDGDDFLLAWSANGDDYSDLFTVSSTSPSNVQSAPITASGTIYVRVTDTNQGSGHGALDTVFVDQLFIRSDNDGEPPPNQPPMADFSYSCSALTCDFTDASSDGDGSVVGWAWNFGDGGTSAAQHPSHTYSAPGSYTVTLTVIDDDAASDNSSQWVMPNETGTINLSASGYKVRGQHVVDLTWSGASGANVDVERDGGVVTTTSNDGAYTDNTGNKGGRTYRYRVCEAGTTTCSNEVTLEF